jgi:hypothetical protein
LESQIIAANIASSQFPTVESVSLHILETISLSLSFFSDNDLWLTKKYDPAAHIDRQSSSSSSSTDFLYFPESFVNAVSSRVLAVGKGQNCFEHYEEAKRVFHYKQPFQGLKGGSQLMKNRMKRMENDDKIQKIRFQNLLLKQQQQVEQSLSQNEDQIVTVGVEEEKQLHRPSSSLSSSSSTVAFQNHQNHQQSQPQSQQSISFMSESRLDFLLDILPLSRDITGHQLQQRPIVATNWNNRNYSERKNDGLEMNDSDGEDPIIEEFFVPG